MNIPLLSSTDILISGGSVAAIKRALEAKKAGAGVFIVSSYNYFGEDVCASMDFNQEKCNELRDFFPELENGPISPMRLKRCLEHKLIRADIPFLFDSYLLRLVRDDSGLYAGALIGNRGGFYIIGAKMIIDGSERALAARQTGMPFQPFIPGLKKIERTVLVEDDAAYDAETLPWNFTVDGKKIVAKKITAELRMNGITPNDFAKAELEMRHRSWSPSIVASADKCRFILEDSSCGLDPESFVFLPQQIDCETAVEKVLAAKCGKPAHIATVSGINTPVKAKLDFSESFRCCKYEKIRIDDVEWPSLDACDVVVAGGGTAGAAAGIGAGRYGADTLVIESKSHPGGIGTEGRIAAYWYGNRGGFTAEVDKNVAELNGSINEGQKWRVESKQYFWERTLRSANSRIWFDSTIIAVEKDAVNVNAILCAGPYGVGIVRTKVVVDATGNSDIAAAAGAETVFSDPDEPALQGTGMPPSIPGVSLYNSDYTFSLDSDVEDTTRTSITSRNLFADEFDSGRLVDTRERRRIVGDLTLQPMDFYLKRSYHDTVNIAYSNFDTHGFTVHPIFMLRPPDKKPLSVKVPLRAMLPRGLENVIVTGLSLSAHRDAMPVIRMQADVQNQGYAAGVAAAMAVEFKQSFRKLDVHTLQRKLVEEGILPEDALTSYDGIADMSLDTIAAAFTDPASAIPGLHKKLKEETPLQDAMLLAFLGDNSGSRKITEYIEFATWDQGWNYTGMHQFGACCSRLDTAIMASANTSLGCGKTAIFRLASELKPETEFSHYRSCALFFMRHPSMEVVPVFEKLLEQPGMKGWAVTGQTQLLEQVNRNHIDTVERNHQLKEFYLAMALTKCDKNNQTGLSILKEYASGLHGLFALHATKLLQAKTLPSAEIQP